MKIINKVESIVWVLITSIAIYLLLPLCLFIFLDKYNAIISVICILFINTLYAFISGIVFTKKNGFSFILSLILGILFIPYGLMIYNNDAIIYSVLYIAVSLISSLIYYKYVIKD